MRKLVFICIFFTQTCFGSALQFPDACTPGERITIAAVGDVLLHHPLQRQASTEGFTSLWQQALPYVRQANFAYANLEGPIAAGVKRDGTITHTKGWDKNIYSSYPQFNYHPSLARALQLSGFDIVSTANNHALDRFAIGIDKTIAELNHVGMKFVGTRSREINNSHVTIVTKNNWKVAWISCTEMTNGINDRYHQVLHCYRPQEKRWILNTIRQLRSEVDAIIITPHWGNEYETRPGQAQKSFAHEVLDAGADAVIGSHPHVLQPIEKYVTKQGRPTLIAYSLGNFVSYQGSLPKRSTIILFLGLTRTVSGVKINSVSYVPMYMQNRQPQMHLACLLNESNPAALNFITEILPRGNMLSAGQAVNASHCSPVNQQALN